MSFNISIDDALLGSFKTACTLLGLDEDGVSDAILTKNITVGGKIIKKAQTAAMAAEEATTAVSKLPATRISQSRMSSRREAARTR